MGDSNVLFRSNAEQIRFASMLSARLKSLAPLYDPDDAMLRDSDWWGKVNRDPKLAHAIRQRLAKVVRSDWHLEPGGKDEQSVRAANVLEEMLRETRQFSASLRHLAKFAFHGNAHAWIEGKREWKVYGQTDKDPVGYLAEWWHMTYLKPLDKRQVMLVPRKDAEGKVHVDTLLATIDGGKHAAMQFPECLVTAVYDDEVERLGSGRGLGEAIWQGYWIKGQLRQKWLRGVARWAEGVVVGKIDATAHADPTKSNADVTQEMVEALVAMAERGVLVLDSRDEAQVLFGGEGTGTAGDAMRYEDEGLVQLILGAVLPTGGGSDVGSNARAEVEVGSTKDLLDTDRELLDEILTETVIKLHWTLNEANFAAVGLAQAKCPRFNSITTHEETPKEAGETLKVAKELGLEIGEDEARRRLGVPKPAANEDVLKAAPEPSFASAIDPFGGGGRQPFGGQQ